MTVASTLLLIVRLVLAAVFAVAALGKLADREGLRVAVRDFGLPGALSAPVALALPLLELAIAGGLVVVDTAAWSAAAAAALLAAFCVGIARLLMRGEAPDCHCFGSAGSAPVGRGTLARNGVLLALAVFVAMAGWGDPGRSLADVGAGVLVLTGLLVLQAAFSWELFKQNGRLLTRVTALEEGGGPAGGADSDASLATGDPAPGFALPDLTGATVTLDDLLRPGRGVLLVFSDPGCGHCDPLLPALGRSRAEDDVPLAVISRGAAEDNRTKAEEHGVAPLLLQEDFEVADRYRVYGLPGAVLVDPDGRVANDPVSGARDVAALLDGLRPEAHLPLHRVEGRT